MDTVALVSAFRSDPALAWILLYVGPDVFMPFLSAIAGAIGLLLMFWRRVTGWAAALWRTIFQR